MMNNNLIKAINIANDEKSTIDQFEKLINTNINNTEGEFTLFYDSKNILKQGLKIILSGSGIESDIKQKQVEALSLDKSMKPETH